VQYSLLSLSITTIFKRGERNLTLEREENKHFINNNNRVEKCGNKQEIYVTGGELQDGVKME
jgi:hypothetical protein